MLLLFFFFIVCFLFYTFWLPFLFSYSRFRYFMDVRGLAKSGREMKTEEAKEEEEGKKSKSMQHLYNFAIFKNNGFRFVDAAQMLCMLCVSVSPMACRASQLINACTRLFLMPFVVRVYNMLVFLSLSLLFMCFVSTCWVCIARVLCIEGFCCCHLFKFYSTSVGCCVSFRICCCCISFAFFILSVSFISVSRYLPLCDAIPYVSSWKCVSVSERIAVNFQQWHNKIYSKN